MKLYQKIGNTPVPFDFVDKDYLESKKYAKMGQASFYICGTNGKNDDTPGRGLSPELPYATISFAVSRIAHKYTGAVYIMLMSDITEERPIDFEYGNYQIAAYSINPKPKITLVRPNPTTLCYFAVKGDGHLNLSNLVIETNNNFVGAYRGGLLTLSNCELTSTGGTTVISGGTLSKVIIYNSISISGESEKFIHLNDNSMLSCINKQYDKAFNGTVTECTILCSENSSAVILGAMSGSVTGKRYEIIHGGKIVTSGRGPNYIPGSEEGTCDETSIYC